MRYPILVSVSVVPYVATETIDVEQWEIRRQALCRLATEVEERLGIEGKRPGEKIEPAAQAVIAISWEYCDPLRSLVGLLTVIPLERTPRSAHQATW